MACNCNKGMPTSYRANSTLGSIRITSTPNQTEQMVSQQIQKAKNFLKYHPQMRVIIKYEEGGPFTEEYIRNALGI